MSRLEWSFAIFSKQGIKFLLMELVIVFAGVYGAFLFQNYSENKRIESERDKVIIGLKEELEYFRIFFPGYAGGEQVEEWQALIDDQKYISFQDWRFIQPQYNYRAIEYALDADARVIDYEVNAGLAEIYQELKKLEFSENLVTEIAMRYQSLPDGLESSPQGKTIQQQNYLNFQLFTERMGDRSRIMSRVANMCKEFLPQINSHFSKKEQKELELQLIGKYLTPDSEAELNESLPLLLNYFPNLSEEELRAALR